MIFELPLLLFFILVGGLNGLAIGSLTLTLIDHRLQKQIQKQLQQIKIVERKQENG